MKYFSEKTEEFDRICKFIDGNYIIFIFTIQLG